MNQSNDDVMLIVLAGYSSITEAVGAFDAVCAVCEADGAAYCDAAVIDPHDTDPSSRVVRETPQSRPQEASGAHVEGLAKRLARYLGEGLALTGGPAGGGGQALPTAAFTGDGTGPLDFDDLNKLGAVQETASAVLIGIFPGAMSDRIAAATHTADPRASKELRASREQLE